ncbi:hypothetical protein VTG60DRAFT_1539 [Thermothelomyces hinnuleus]
MGHGWGLLFSGRVVFGLRCIAYCCMYSTYMGRRVIWVERERERGSIARDHHHWHQGACSLVVYFYRHDATVIQTPAVPRIISSDKSDSGNLKQNACAPPLVTVHAVHHQPSSRAKSSFFVSPHSVTLPNSLFHPSPPPPTTGLRPSLRRKRQIDAAVVAAVVNAQAGLGLFPPPGTRRVADRTG